MFFPRVYMCLLAVSMPAIAATLKYTRASLADAGVVHSGDGTFFDTGLGACGETNTDADLIAAVGHVLFDTFPGFNGANPNANPVCGKTITAKANGKSVTVKVVDRCVGCSEFDLDFSPAAFQQLADESAGRIAITWSFD
ncbi:RlpA-like double-psi beta-barrel-protein domain-containing protein-containing protein [Phanerochaete sordida]|uniref:RlpA-like double-psi beta-barrel-protein domain-containing protein-containing protein n=1 Tax=Phanerochaete sordida TaxID=48140 RepID=A0A9P3LJ11_9APHY|nr:RlpA-like double-psi beta-barrel-protein domain-containing protein-containing protein [Phanerochaete sordida]